MSHIVQQCRHAQVSEIALCSVRVQMYGSGLNRGTFLYGIEAFFSEGRGAKRMFEARVGSRRIYLVYESRLLDSLQTLQERRIYYGDLMPREIKVAEEGVVNNFGSVRPAGAMFAESPFNETFDTALKALASRSDICCHLTADYIAYTGARS